MLFPKHLDEHHINVSYQPTPDEYRTLLENPEPDMDYNRLLEGKVCLVTGASYGMGYDMAELYAREGARLIITARGKERLEEAAEKIRQKVPGADVLPVVADSTKKEDIENVFNIIKEKYGRLDTLVNNAGIGDQYRPECFSDETLDYIVEVDFKGPARYCREALKIMLPQEYGNIVNVSSVNGVRPLFGSVYSSCKSGLNGLTKSIAIRCVGTGVHCNAMCPGFTVTPASLSHESGKSQKEVGVDMRPILTTKSTRNAPTLPIDQANLALFLGSDMSRCVNGQIIVCDNGQYL